MVRDAHPTIGLILMPNYRRCYVPGGSYFFTVVTERRASILGTDLARDLLRAAFRDCFDRWPPFQVDAMVMLRDHLHAIWTLPPGDADYSKRWAPSKNTSPNPGSRAAVQKNRSLPPVNPDVGGACGNGAFGNIPCATNGIMRAISITSTTTRSNMGW